MRKIRRCLCSWDLLIFHASCALRAEFTRYYLHFIWWFLEPIFNLVILYLVFGVFLASKVPNYTLFLLTGLVLWQWFATTVPHATISIYSSMRMFQQFRVSPIHFPLCVFLQDLAKYTPVFLVFLLAAAIFSPTGPSLVWLQIVPVMLIEGLCVAGTAILVAALVPFLPDLAVVIPIMVQALFFASGIFFDIDRVVLAQHQMILYFNPNAVCIKSMRDIILAGNSPDWSLLGYAFLLSLSIFIVGFTLAISCRKIYPRIIEQ